MAEKQKENKTKYLEVIMVRMMMVTMNLSTIIMITIPKIRWM